MKALGALGRLPIGWQMFAATTVISLSLGPVFDFDGVFFGVITLMMVVSGCRPKSVLWILIGALGALWVWTFGVSVADREWSAMNAWGLAWYTFTNWAVFLTVAAVLGLLIRGLVTFGRRLPLRWRSMDIHGAVDDRT